MYFTKSDYLSAIQNWKYLLLGLIVNYIKFYGVRPVNSRMSFDKAFSPAIPNSWVQKYTDCVHCMDIYVGLVLT